MRIVKYTGRFRRDYKREKSGRHRQSLEAALLETVTLLVLVRVDVRTVVEVGDAELAEPVTAPAVLLPDGALYDAGTTAEADESD